MRKTVSSCECIVLCGRVKKNYKNTETYSQMQIQYVSRNKNGNFSLGFSLKNKKKGTQELKNKPFLFAFTLAMALKVDLDPFLLHFCFNRVSLCFYFKSSHLYI